MAHFAKLGVNNKVIAVHVLDNDKMLNASNVEDETIGRQELQRIHGWPEALWVQYSYNTRGGKHYQADGSESADQSKAIRGNAAAIGMIYDETNDIFIEKQPHASWTLNTTTATWEAPITYPSIEIYDHPSDTLADGEFSPDGRAVGQPKPMKYDITWDESAYQSDNNTGWKAEKYDGSIVSWNGSAWV